MKFNLFPGKNGSFHSNLKSHLAADFVQKFILVNFDFRYKVGQFGWKQSTWFEFVNEIQVETLKI